MKLNKHCNRPIPIRQHINKINNLGQSIAPFIVAKHITKLSEYQPKSVQTGDRIKLHFQETTGYWFPCPSMKYENFTSDSSFFFRSCKGRGSVSYLIYLFVDPILNFSVPCQLQTYIIISNPSKHIALIISTFQISLSLPIWCFFGHPQTYCSTSNIQ